MATRRSHEKSRLGCGQCKSRKVKCDLATPKCSHCARRNQECSLTEARLYLAKSKISVNLAYGDRSAHVPTKPSESDDAPDMYTRVDVELAHFYASETSKCIMAQPQAASLWKNEVFHLSLEHPILLDALLTTAAMHKLITHSDCARTSFYTEVIQQKGVGMIPHLIDLLKEPSKENCAILMVSSVLLTVWAFSSIRLPPEANLFATPELIDSTLPLSDCERRSTPRLDDLIVVLSISQGTRVVGAGLTEWLNSSGYGALIAAPDIDNLNLPPPPDDILAALVSLEGHCKSEYGPQGTFEDYSVQLRRLYEIFCLRQCPEWHDMIIGFGIRLESAMIELLKLRDPCALAILAFWAACLRSVESKWWVHAWPKALFHEILLVLDDDWKKHLQVPEKFFQHEF